MNTTTSRLQSRSRLVPASLVLGLLASIQSAFGQLSWDPGFTPATPSGGTGTWDGNATNWSNGTSDVVFANNSIANFGGVAGTVTLGSARTANGVNFNISGYTLSGANDLTVNAPLSGTNNTIVFAGATTVNLRKLIATGGGSGNIGNWQNTDFVNFSSTTVAIGGSRQFAITNSSASGTTTISNFAFNPNAANGSNGSVWINQGNLTIANLAGGANADGSLAAANLAGTGTTILKFRGTGSGIVTLAGNNTLLNDSGASTGNAQIGFYSSTLTFDIGHDNALGARNASNSLTDTLVDLNGGTLRAINGARNIENTVIQTGAFTLGGSNAITLAGSFTNQGANNTLTVSNSAATTLAGNLFLANDNTTARTFTLAGAGNTTISGVIANNNFGGTVASAFTVTSTGVTTLSGASTYTGATTISAGIVLQNGSHVGLGSYSVANGATFGGTGSVDLSAGANGVTFANGAKLQASSADSLVFTLGAGTLNLSAAVAAATPSLLFTLGAPGSTVVSATSASIGSGLLNFDDFSFTTGVGFGAGTYTLFDLTSLGGTLGSSLAGTVGGLGAIIGLDGNDIILTVSAIPEPSSFAGLAGLAALGLVAARRRRR